MQLYGVIVNRSCLARARVHGGPKLNLKPSEFIWLGLDPTLMAPTHILNILQYLTLFFLRIVQYLIWLQIIISMIYY